MQRMISFSPNRRTSKPSSPTMFCVSTPSAGATLEGPGEEALRVHRLPHRAVRGEVQGEGGDRRFAAQPSPEVTSRDPYPNITISPSPQARDPAPLLEPGVLPRTPRRKRRRRRTRKRVPAGAVAGVAKRVLVWKLPGLHNQYRCCSWTVISCLKSSALITSVGVST